MPIQEYIGRAGLSRKMLGFFLGGNVSNANASVNDNSQKYSIIELLEPANTGEALELYNGKARRANKESAGVLFAAVSGGNTGNSIPIIYLGESSVQGANFTPGKPVFLKSGSPNVTTEPPDFSVSGYYRKVGTATSISKMDFTPEPRTYIE